MIPAFADAGLLPEGLHRATWEEVVTRFGCTRRRSRLLAGLLEAATNLRDAGARYLWLDGSFTTAKPDPDDYDCAWDGQGVDFSKVDPVLIDLVDIRSGRIARKPSTAASFSSAQSHHPACRSSSTSSKTRTATQKESYCST